MKNTPHWGRKETIVWPPQVPIYSWAIFGAAVLATVFFAWEHLRFSQSVLQRSYTSTYIQSSIGSVFKQHGSYQLLYLAGAQKIPPRLALPADFEEGGTVLSDGQRLPIALSTAATAAGYSTFFRGPVKVYRDTALSQWLRGTFFEGEGLFATYRVSLIEGLVLFLAGLGFAVPADLRRFKELKYGRLLKGPLMLTPKEFNKALKGDGLGIRTDHDGTILRLPRSAEAKHIQIMGDTGAGKSTLLMQLLQQIADRKEAAIVYDPAGEFTQRFYSKERGDVILNPLDSRCPYWSPSSELKNPAEARTIAASLYQSTEEKKGEFFTQTPQKIFAHLCGTNPPRSCWCTGWPTKMRSIVGSPEPSWHPSSPRARSSNAAAFLPRSVWWRTASDSFPH